MSMSAGRAVRIMALAALGASPAWGWTSPPGADFGREKPSAAAREVADWVVRSGDHRGTSFALIDKVQARLYVFDPEGHLQGASAVLLGLAKGDHTVPGIGDKPLSAIARHERTTPAGRFAAEPGRNTAGEDIVWVDYDAAVSMHRVRPVHAKERRLERLASATPKDNRISYGCINVPAAFYDQHVVPALAKRRGVVYILPETRPASAVFSMGASGVTADTAKAVAPGKGARPL